MLARVGRVLAWIVGGMIALVVVAVAALTIYVRSEAGHARLLRYAVTSARNAVPGLEVGRLEGDYLHRLRLVDVSVRDRSGRVAVRADAVEVKYAWRPLLHKTVIVDELRVMGLHVEAVQEEDGHFNLADLTKPSEPTTTPPPGKPSQPPAWQVTVSQIAIDGGAELLRLDAPPLEVDALHLLASLHLANAVDVRVERLAVDLGAAGRVDVAGSGHLSPNAQPPLDAFDVELQARDVSPAAFGAGPAAHLDVDAKATGHGKHWEVNLDRAAMVGLSVQGHGEGLGSRIDDAKVRVAVEGDRLPRAVRGPVVAGRGELTIEAKGAWPELEVTAKGDARGLRVADARVGDLVIDGRVAGPMTAPRGHVSVVAKAIVASPTAPRFDRATLIASNDGKDVKVDVTAAGPRGRGEVRARGHADGRTFTVAVEKASADFTTAKFRQQLALLRPLDVEFTPGHRVRWSGLSLHGRGYLFTGDATSDGVYRFEPTAREALAEGRLGLKGASLRALPSVDADVTATVGRRRSDVKVAAHLPDGAALSLDASVPLLIPARGAPRLASTGPLTAHVDLRALRLQDVPGVHEALEAQGITGGVATLTLALTGDVAHPDAKGRFDLRDVMYRQIHGLGRDSTLKTVKGLGGSLALETAPGTTRLEGSVLIRNVGVLQLDATARVELGRLLAGVDPKTVPTHVHLDVPGLELASLSDFVDELHGVSGRLTGAADVDGTASAARGTGHLEIANAKVDEVNFREVSLRGSSDGATAEAKLTVAEAVGGSLLATVNLDRRHEPRIDAQATARDLDLRFARLFVPTVRETAGVAQLTARATGPLATPKVSGTLTIEKGRLGLIGQPTFRDISLAAKLEPGRAELTKLTVRSGNGQLSGTGWAALDGLRPTRAVFSASAHRFLVAADGSTGALLDGDVAAEAVLRTDVVSGRVKVPRAEVWLPKTPSASGQKLQRVGPHADVRFVDATARAAAERQRADEGRARAQARDLDVRVKTGPIYVRGKDMDIELDSHLVVGRATDGKPTVGGGIHVRRGRINIQGQRFDFSRGDIDFDGSSDVNPQLDIAIQRQYPDALVTVAIHGTPRKPELRLTSDPPVYDEAQIVSLVLTGQPGGAPSNGKSFDPKAAVATAVLSRLADQLAPEVGLDVLRVESVDQVDKEGTSTGDTDTRIEVGKYVSERIYLSYAHVFGANEYTNQNEAHVEYRLTRRWMVESVFGDAGVGGVDALWTYRY